jgi:OmpA-OmpF porin, OOP family
MKHLKSTVAATLLICGATQAQAQEIFNRSWYILPSATWLDADNEFRVGKRGDGAGLRFGTPLSNDWDFQIGGSHTRARQSDMRYVQDMMGAEWLYMFSRDTFRPFLVVGIGAQRDKLSTPPASAKKTSPYITAGLGFQYDFSEHWGTQLDYRRVHGHLRDNEFGFKRSDNDYVTLGIIYRLGGTPQSARRYSQASPAPQMQSTYVPSPPVAVRPEPVQIAAPAAAPTPPPPRVERYVLNATELFEFDHADLHTAQPRLDQIALAMRDNPQVSNVNVYGYTDRLGSEAYNMGLSNRRATAVRDYLVSKGVSSNRVTAQGRGETEPVVDCTQSNRAALIKCLEPNRRVEVEQLSFERRLP